MKMIIARSGRLLLNELDVISCDGLHVYVRNTWVAIGHAEQIVHQLHCVCIM